MSYYAPRLSFNRPDNIATRIIFLNFPVLMRIDRGPVEFRIRGLAIKLRETLERKKKKNVHGEKAWARKESSFVKRLSR